MIDQILKTLEGAYADNTIKAYASDMRVFTAFTAPKEPLLPASTELIADYIAALAEQRKSFATIKRHVATLSAMHRFGGFEDPTKAIVVKLALRRAGRQLGSAQRQVAPINRPLLDRMLATCEDSLIDARDRALLLLAYETARRRSELVAFSVEDLIKAEGRIAGLWLRKSKTDQFGTGKRLALSETAAQAIEAWVRLANLESGPLLRAIRGHKIEDSLSAGQVARIFKTRAKKAGAGRERADRISGHSLRVGKAQDLLFRGRKPHADHGQWRLAKASNRHALLRKCSTGTALLRPSLRKKQPASLNSCWPLPSKFAISRDRFTELVSYFTQAFRVCWIST